MNIDNDDVVKGRSDYVDHRRGTVLLNNDRCCQGGHEISLASLLWGAVATLSFSEVPLGLDDFYILRLP